MTQAERNKSEWNNPENWKYFLFYYSPADSRVWVPKKPEWMGWTLNFAHPSSYLWLLTILAIPLTIALIILSHLST